VESEAELANLAALAAEMGKAARVALRVNPDVDPKTHVYTTTGKRETKFGVDLERARRVFDEYGSIPSVELVGLHLHLGSPVNTVEPYIASITKALTLIDELGRDGHRVRALNLGGGFGAYYESEEAPTASEYARRIVPLLQDRGLEVLLEPGRSIAANAGIILTRVLYTKASGERQFVIVDASMTELIRPALYGSFHSVWPVMPLDGMLPTLRGGASASDGLQLVDIVGPVCESGDFIAKGRRIPKVSRGELLCVFSAGAYGFVMSSQYNSRPRSPEVLIDGASTRLIRRRETYDDLVGPERL
jgi:diaminopimelate decarboxylase